MSEWLAGWVSGRDWRVATATATEASQGENKLEELNLTVERSEETTAPLEFCPRVVGGGGAAGAGRVRSGKVPVTVAI